MCACVHVLVSTQRDGSVEIAGLEVERVEQPEEVYVLLKRAAQHRATGETKSNEQRDH